MQKSEKTKPFLFFSLHIANLKNFIRFIHHFNSTNSAMKRNIMIPANAIICFLNIALVSEKLLKIFSIKNFVKYNFI